MIFPPFSGFPTLPTDHTSWEGNTSVSIQTAPSIISGVHTRNSETTRRRLPVDEVVNTITHGIGIPLSLAGAALLLTSAAATGDAWRIAGCAVYSVTLVGVFTASTLSHCFVCPKARDLFRAVDQALIYLLIAGCYTAFSVAYLHGPWWQVQLGLMWVIALTGFVSKFCYSHRINSCRIWSYILLACLGASPAFYMLGAVPLGLHGWVVFGWAAFLLGVVFFVLDIKRFHFHAVWHILVIAGCSCHFAAIYFYVANIA
jgi:hemolysin III